jgi:hypothetical protein
MRPFNVKLWSCIGLLIGFLIGSAIIIGCGSGNDLLDEVGGRTVVDLSLSDAGNSGVHEIDIVQNLDCDGDPTTNDPEDFFEVTGTITVTVADDAPGLTMLSYVVNYYAVPGADSKGVIQTPPAIESKQGQFNSFDVDSGASNSDTIIVMTIDQKLALASELWGAGADPAYTNVDTVLYNIEVVITYQDYEGHTKTKSLYIDVNMGAYDNC